jgi:uncharacterized protein
VTSLRQRLEGIVRGDASFMGWLRAARECCPPDWAIGAGALRNLVWDHLTGRRNPPRDVDVAFFDPTGQADERVVEACLAGRFPDVVWDARNQALVHTWYERRFGIAVEPLDSLDEAIGTFPETCTSVAVRLLADDGMEVFAPCGLEDLFGLVLRRNPTRVTREIFIRRLREKRPQDHWPGIELVAG